MRTIGVHYRIEDNYTKLLQQALDAGANSCQFFLISQNGSRYVKLTPEDKATFLELKNKHLLEIYAHGSYWINAATGNEESSKISRTLLSKEIQIAKELGIKNIVLHAGSAKGFPQDRNDPLSRTQGIEAVASILNELAIQKDVSILIENTAHGGKTVCSDLNDFKRLRKILSPEANVGFCLDTSHAFAYEYDLKETEKFMELLDQTMGIENIKLLHLNDSAKQKASKIDQHEIPGEGTIGKESLEKIINHEKLKHLPIIIEPPLIPSEKIREVISEVKKW